MPVDIRLSRESKPRLIPICCIRGAACNLAAVSVEERRDVLEDVNPAAMMNAIILLYRDYYQRILPPVEVLRMLAG
jgi:hypothetical protein